MKKTYLIIFAAMFSVTAFSQSYKGSSHIASQEEKLNKQYCTGLFQSTHGTILEVASASSKNGYYNILNWLQGRVAGLQVYTLRSGISIPVMRGAIPAIYIDEIPVSPDFLQMLNVNDIAIVKVIKEPFWGGFNGRSGAIAIYTLHGEDDEEETIAGK